MGRCRYSFWYQYTFAYHYCIMMIPVFACVCRHFEDFEQRIPRVEMEKLEAIVLREIETLDSDYEAKICGSFRRGRLS